MKLYRHYADGGCPDLTRLDNEINSGLSKRRTVGIKSKKGKDMWVEPSIPEPTVSVTLFGREQNQ